MGGRPLRRPPIEAQNVGGTPAVPKGPAASQRSTILKQRHLLGRAGVEFRQAIYS